MLTLLTLREQRSQWPPLMTAMLVEKNVDELKNGVHEKNSMGTVFRAGGHERALERGGGGGGGAGPRVGIFGGGGRGGPGHLSQSMTLISLMSTT
jgi:hypothetical protein